MRWLDHIIYCAKSLFQKRKLDTQLSEEIRAHVEMATEANVAKGMSPKEARYAAMREFGGVEQIKERTRDERGWVWLENLWRDWVQAGRQMRQNKGFSTVIIVTFALVVGLNAILFSLFNSLWLNPGLYPDEDHVVRVFETFSDDVEKRRGSSQPLYIDWAEQSQLAEEIGLSLKMFGNITQQGADPAPEFRYKLLITPSLFRVLGVPPLLGRVFTEEETGSGNDGVVVLFHDYWQARYHSDPSVIGKTLYTSGQPREIIGVMPENFRIPDVYHISDNIDFTPVVMVPVGPHNWPGWASRPSRRYTNYAGCFARLKPGVSATALREELTAINVRNGPLYPEQFELAQDREHRTEVVTINQDLLRENRAFLYLLQGSLAFVLLIACVNVTSLVMGRSIFRQHEFAVRLALGAGRFRLVRQLVTEVWLLAVIGGMVGLGMAAAGMQALELTGISKFFVVPPRLEIDGRVAAFALVLSSLAGVAAGLASALPLLRNRPVGPALAEDARTGTAGREAKAFRASLLVTQIAFTVVLLVGGLLLLRSFTQILRIDPGYDTGKLLTLYLYLPQDRGYDDDGRKQFIANLERRLHDLPGVAAAGVTTWPPLKVGGVSTVHFIRPETNYLDVAPPSSTSDFVSVHFFDALDIQLLRGRLFSAVDIDERAAVAVIDERVARAHFPDEDPIGQLIAIPYLQRQLNAETSLDWLRIVGVVKPVRVDNLLSYSEDGGMVYQTYSYINGRGGTWVGMVVRTRDDPARLLKPVSDLIGEMEPLAAVAYPETMTETIKRRYSYQQAFLIVNLVIAMVALLICAVGIYGMMAHSIATQTKEIAIRRALGAQDLILFRGIMSYWLKTATIGLAIGLFAALLLSRFLVGVLYQITPTDYVSYGVSLLLLSLTVLVAAMASGRKALSLNIVEVLRR